MGNIGLANEMNLCSHKRGATKYAIGKHFRVLSHMVGIIVSIYCLAHIDFYKSLSHTHAGTMSLSIATILTERLCA